MAERHRDTRRAVTNLSDRLWFPDLVVPRHGQESEACDQ